MNEPHIIPVINDDYAVNPSLEGLALIEDNFPIHHKQLIRLASSGSHVMNAYHNLHHELSCVYWAHACAVNSSKRDFDLKALLLGPLFHDHNHSGGRLSDFENVERALDFWKTRMWAKVENEVFDAVIKIISCTEFTDGKFPIEPVTFEAQCMRDADLMSIYSYEGRELLICLAHEMGFNLINDDEEFLEKSNTFLKGARMFTEHGHYMHSTFLSDCLELLEVQVEEYREAMLSSE